MEHLNKLDFTSQPVYVGIDVHKKSWSVSIHTQHVEHKTFTQPPEVQTLLRYLSRTFPRATYHVAYEAGFSGFWLHDQLQTQGVHCIVVNPADVPTKNKEHVGKTDRVDCRKLARSLKNGDLHGIYVPSRTHVEDRGLLRTRTRMVRKQTRCKNQIKAILFFYGIHIPEDRSWSRRFIKYLETLRMEKTSGDLSLKAHLEELHHLRQIIATLNLAIRKLSRTEPYRNRVALLKTIPGINVLTAMILLTELCDIGRFTSLDKLCSYVGVIPSTVSSGEKEYDRGITTRKNPMLRTVLIEASWVAVCKDPALLMAFNKLSTRMKKTNAIVHIARKLLNRIRYVLKNQKPYIPAVA